MKIYCIGIGGIGLSALARYYKHQGHEVSGSDVSDSMLIQTLMNEGIHIDIGHRKENIPDGTDLVVYTIAVSDTNEDLVRARELGLTCMTYPQALGEITKEKKTIAVCGTHGKTTTTAMAYHALKACGINPTVIVGSLLSGVGSNFIPGDSEYFVVEACEYRRSFLNLFPTYVLVTNIDADHLDYYKDLADIQDAFQSFADKLPKEGHLITHGNVYLETQGVLDNADVIDTSTIELSVMGEHNRENAQLILALVQALSLDMESARKGLKNFAGTWRRLEQKGRTKHGVLVYDDYGHHPAEIKATLHAVRSQYPKDQDELNVFFQPHLFSRTKTFLNDFGSALTEADKVFVLPIYAAREADDASISSGKLVEKINELGGHATLLPKDSMSEVIESIQNNKSVVVNMGAGDAYMELNKVQYI
jgi:UDP-N-acetylmuramate--alanine ligase